MEFSITKPCPKCARPKYVRRPVHYEQHDPSIGRTLPPHCVRGKNDAGGVSLVRICSEGSFIEVGQILPLLNQRSVDPLLPASELERDNVVRTHAWKILSVLVGAPLARMRF
jgi:hypothetical protein